MDSTAWKWALSFSFFDLLLGFLINILTQLLYLALGFWLPDADIPLANIPFLIIVLVMIIFSEER